MPTHGAHRQFPSLSHLRDREIAPVESGFPPTPVVSAESDTLCESPTTPNQSISNHGLPARALRPRQLVRGRSPVQLGPTMLPLPDGAAPNVEASRISFS